MQSASGAKPAELTKLDNPIQIGCLADFISEATLQAHVIYAFDLAYEDLGRLMLSAVQET